MRHARLDPKRALHSKGWIATELALPEFCNIKRRKSGRPDLCRQARNDGGWISANSYMESGRDIQRMSGIAGNTQPRPATT
jgi:hypothetical protein